jgi:hypothetical protein
MKATLTVRVELSPNALQALSREVNGSGGFQSLLRALQRQVENGGNTLVLTPDLVGKIARYVQNYGQGGFQGRLDGVLAELTQLAKALEPMAA